MDHLTPQQRVEVIKTFYSNNRSNVNTRRKLRDFFGVNHVPSKSTIQRIISNFENLYTLGDKPKSGRQRSQRTPENIEAVRQSVWKSPGISHRRRAEELGMSPSCLLKILKEDLVGVEKDDNGEAEEAEQLQEKDDETFDRRQTVCAPDSDDEVAEKKTAVKRKSVIGKTRRK